MTKFTIRLFGFTILELMFETPFRNNPTFTFWLEDEDAWTPEERCADSACSCRSTKTVSEFYRTHPKEREEAAAEFDKKCKFFNASDEDERRPPREVL